MMKLDMMTSAEICFRSQRSRTCLFCY